MANSEIFHFSHNMRKCIFELSMLRNQDSEQPVHSCSLTHLLKPYGWPLVREKSGKSYFSSRSGKSRGILQNGQGNFKCQEKEFPNFGPKLLGFGRYCIHFE